MIYSLISDPLDLDTDNMPLVVLENNGVLKIADTDEILLSAGKTHQLIISLSDPGVKAHH